MILKKNLFIMALIGASLNVLSQGNNIASDKPVTMSSVFKGHQGHYIVDGTQELEALEDEELTSGWAQTYSGQYQYVQIDLGIPYTLKSVSLYTKGLKTAKNSDLIVTASNDPKFKGVYNPADCKNNGINTKYLNSYTDIAITPINSVDISGRYVRIWDTKYGGITLVEIELYGSISSKGAESALQSARSASEATNIINKTIEEGGNIDQESSLKMAIDQKSTDMVQAILDNNRSVSSSTFNYAVKNGNSDMLLKLLGSGDVEFTSDAITSVIKNRDNAVIKKMLNVSNTSFNASHVEEAFKLGNTEMGESILNKANLVPSSNVLKIAVRKGDMLLVSNLINNYGAQTSSSMLTDAIRFENQSMIDLFLNKVKPESEAYVLAARNNDVELFSSLIDIKPLSDNRAIQVAIDKGNKSIVKTGLANGGNVNDALSYAASKNKKELVEYLLTVDGSDANLVINYAINQKNAPLLDSILNEYNGDANEALKLAIGIKSNDLAILALETGKTKPSSYLKPAVEEGNTVLAKKIVEFGGDPDLGMETAIIKNNTALVEYFIEADASVTNSNFIKTSAASNFNITKMLVDAGAKPNDGIAIACENGKLDIVEFLVGEGADSNKGISVASEKGFTSIVQLLLENDADANLGIEKAISKNNTETSLLLLDNGADAENSKLIASSASNKNIKVTEKLIENGANPNNGLSNSIKVNAYKVLQLLIDNDADANKSGYMDLAVKSGASNTISILVNQGINMKSLYADGSNYIHASIKGANSLNTVIALIKAKVDVNQKDNKGNTPIHLAAIKGKDFIPTIQALAQNGADVNAVNNEGKTPRKAAKGARTKTALKKLGGEKK